MPDLIYRSTADRFAVDRCLPQRSAIEAGKVGFHGLSHGHYPGTLMPEDMLPGVASMGFFDVADEQDWGMEEHRNEGIEICLQEIVWTLDGMAEICGMGRSAFSGYCHELTNVSPIDYLNRCRLESAARQLVSQPEASITAIALDCGFSSSQYFCRRFKARYGMTPRAWRTNQA
ncbi:MAG: helix-turn-helix transcriptional regulator [Fuerstiella sp.]|nr:helix-turn-helix transcriptional regulator [Fuerstiella sp.]MCP4855811.1 helix-turn-helix transcriptional regulator [Fuerstiella sp.]